MIVKIYFDDGRVKEFRYVESVERINNSIIVISSHEDKRMRYQKNLDGIITCTIWFEKEV